MSWLMTEYLCRCGHRFESLEDRAEVARYRGCPVCKVLLAERVVSAPKFKQALAVVDRASGPKVERPTGAFDTRAIADGMTTSEWKARRRKQRDDQRRAWVRSVL